MSFNAVQINTVFRGLLRFFSAVPESFSRTLYCPAVFGHCSSAPEKTDRAVRIQ